MTAIAIADCTVKRGSPQLDVTDFYVETPATTVSADTIAITLGDYGIAAAGFLYIGGVIHTTANSIVAAEAPTTSVTSGVLTVTVGGSAATDTRVYHIVGRSV